MRDWFQRRYGNQIPSHRFVRMLIEGPGLTEQAHAAMLSRVVEEAGYELVPRVPVDADADGLASQLTEITAALGEAARAAIEVTGELSAGGNEITTEEARQLAERVGEVRRHATELQLALIERANGGAR